MPRRSRLETPGTLRHIMTRGINGSEIFLDEEDRKAFLTLFGKEVIKAERTIRKQGSDNSCYSPTSPKCFLRHIMTRGINGSEIFLDEEDRKAFLTRFGKEVIKAERTIRKQGGDNSCYSPTSPKCFWCVRAEERIHRNRL